MVTFLFFSSSIEKKKKIRSLGRRRSKSDKEAPETSQRAKTTTSFRAKVRKKSSIERSFAGRKRRRGRDAVASYGLDRTNERTSREGERPKNERTNANEAFARDVEEAFESSLSQSSSSSLGLERDLVFPHEKSSKGNNKTLTV